MGTLRTSAGPNQCHSSTSNYGLIIQRPDTITFLYSDNMDVRRVHLNHGHQEPLTPALYGDSTGHYEGTRW
jgi:hypothetical protein